MDESDDLFYEVEARSGGRWLPIDVAAAAGRQVLAVQANAPDDRTMERAYPITVAARTFPARRITVEPKFVDPPADELAENRSGAEGRRSDLRARRRASASGVSRSSFRFPARRPAVSAAAPSSTAQPRGQHTGTDFQAATGTPVVAPNRGRIALAADQYFPGPNTIIIDHGLGVYSYLAHLSEFTVEEGAMVERGQRIALSGATGRVTGPHLHWTMRLGSARVDPLSLVRCSRDARIGG